MNKSQNNESLPGITLSDIYFVLFRHKWKIIFLSAAGIVAGIVYYVVNPPPFQSEAELLVRYILDSRSPNPTSNNTKETSPAELGDSIMNSEIKILTSFDVAEAVAKNIGPEKILARLGGGNDLIKAANAIKDNLNVEAPDNGNVIDIIFRNPDRTVVQPVLQEIVSVYLDKDLEIHQSVGHSDDFLTEETAQLSSQIAQTEDELVAVKTNAGIISIEIAETSYAQQVARIREEILQAEANLAEHQVALDSGTTTAAPENKTSSDIQEEYQNICAHLDFLNHRQNDYLTQQGYTEENKLVVEVRGQIAETGKLKKNLEDKFPSLAGSYIPSSNLSTQELSSADGMEGVVSPKLRIAVLKQELNQIQADEANMDEAESKISDLQRKKQVQEGNYQYYASSLEQARIDETLGSGRVSNINLIQTPTPPFKDRSKKIKSVLLMMIGGVGCGLAWAFLIELYFDTSVKRPIEVEAKLKLPLFLSIPDISRNGHKHLAGTAKRRLLQSGDDVPAAAGANELKMTAWEMGNILNPFYDALRDRLMAYFESINLTRKPKLVAVTGTEKGSGVSTIAAGLAASLSETGDGRVLLVDMNQERGSAQQFFRGEVDCLLDDALVSERRDSARVQENLYVVTENSSDKLQRVLPKRFASLVPKLKASDYDYIIFDMPPVSQTSVTARLAGLMDMTLLMIESEKTNRNTVLQAAALLSLSKASVVGVLNKTRKYIPDRLHRESL
jgi:succinoglycan biosynthesis transport protein ExoP